jgi:pimeloyl-ACP methyl ester carboxylesterase
VRYPGFIYYSYLHANLSFMKNIKTLLLIAVAVILTLSTQAQSDPFAGSIYGKNAQAGHYIKTRGFKMYYETYGSGEPVLFIHGNDGSIEDFTCQIPYFSKNYKVIAADSRAQGKSVDTGDSLSYEMMADDLNALLDSLHLTSCYIVGWSDGGINGLLLAIRHPDKVKKLAITGANLWPDTSAVDPFIYKWAMNYNDSLAHLKPTPEIKADLKLAHLLSYEPHITVQQLHQIRCPTLVIGGDHDVILPQHTMLIAQSIPHSYLWILPNSGHSTPVFYKDQFNDNVNKFFTTLYREITGYGKLE